MTRLRYWLAVKIADLAWLILPKRVRVEHQQVWDLGVEALETYVRKIPESEGK